VHVDRGLAIRHGRTGALRWARTVAANGHGVGAEVAAVGRAEHWGTGVGTPIVMLVMKFGVMVVCMCV
jgi:hypothetical protein